MIRLLLLSLLLTSQLALAKTIGKVSLEGVNSIQERIVRGILNEKLATNLSHSNIESVIAALYETGEFYGIEVYEETSGDKSNLTFRFLSMKVIKTIRINGNESFSRSEVIENLGMDEGQTLSTDQLKSGVENIQKFLNLSGFLNAKVSADVLAIEASSKVNLTINITEGAPCIIQDFYFKTSNNDLNKNLQQFFKKFLKKRFSQALSTQMQNEADLYLFENQYYSTALKAPEILYNPLKTTVSITFTVEDPFSYSLVFEGNELFSEYRLFRELKLDPDNRLSTYPVDDLTDRLIRFYKSKGYANVKVISKEELFAQGFTRRVRFKISEGPKVKISEIIFDGRISQSSKDYEKLLLEVSPDLISRKIFNSDDLDTGIKNLVTTLQNQGFIDTKIIGTRVEFNKRRDSVIIRVNMDEGPRTYIKAVVFRGIKQVSENELQIVTELTPREALSLSNLEASFNKILDYYRNHGFLEARVLNQGQNVITYSDNNTQAVITFDIYEGPLITVDNILIEGNSFTKDNVIRRELQFSPGETLTPEAIDYSEQRLQRLSLFNSVEIRTMEENPNQGNRTVLVKVSEGNPGIFKMGIGVNNELDLSVKSFMGAAYRNLWGTGRGVNGRIEVNNKLRYNFYESDFTMGYSEPFIFNTRNTVRLNLSQSRRIFQIDRTEEDPYVFALDSRQGNIFVERDITRYLKVIYEIYGLAHTNQFEIRNRVDSRPLDIGTTGPTVSWDKRNDPFNPTRGFLLSGSLEYSDPYLGSTDTVKYYKAVASHSRYISLGSVVWATEARAGYLRNLSDLEDSAVPKIKAFVLGGRSSIRGFDPSREAFPNNNNPGFANGIHQHSNFYLFKTEFRIPVWGNFGTNIFYDGGGVYYPGFSPQFPWRDSVGIGFRYITPVGPFSVEYGHKLNRDTNRGEGHGFFHISFGQF